jgi:putative ABC transport system permease protein
MFLNALLIALREIRRNPTRSFLTVIGVVIGVASVVTMVTLGRAATEQVKRQISKVGNNLIILRPGESRRDAAPRFTLADVRAIQQQVPGIADLAPFVQTSGRAVYGENTRLTDVQGTTPGYFAIANWELADGRFFTDEEVAEALPVCVIGETIRTELFGPGVDPIGAKIRMRTTTFEVVGLTAVKGRSGTSDDLDDNIITPYTTVLRRMVGHGDGRNISSIMISCRDGYPSEHLVADLALLMRERRNLAPNEENTFSAFDSRQLAEVMGASTEVLTALLGAVAGVSLLVGGIGIMNIMLVSVTERTREIGIRLAIGARAREVLLQFLVEAVTLSCFGGLAGILLAYFLCSTLAEVVGAPFEFDPVINVVAFVFSAAVGVLFGFTPARRAAALDPIEALRYE